MNSLIFVIVMALLSYAFDKIKESQKNEEKPKVKKKKNKVNSSNIQNTQGEKRGTLDNRIQKTPRVIVDREKEIYTNSQIVDKEKIVNDIIFSEILSKPKSRR